MKKITLTTLILVLTISSSWAKPGGWFFDLLRCEDRNLERAGYYKRYEYGQPVYYVIEQRGYRPATYQPPTLIFTRPVHVQPNNVYYYPNYNR